MSKENYSQVASAKRSTRFAEIMINIYNHIQHVRKAFTVVHLG